MSCLPADQVILYTSWITRPCPGLSNSIWVPQNLCLASDIQIVFELMWNDHTLWKHFTCRCLFPGGILDYVVIANPSIYILFSKNSYLGKYWRDSIAGCQVPTFSYFFGIVLFFRKKSYFWGINPIFPIFFRF